jgi:PAS domain S-box-containing protein
VEVCGISSDITERKRAEEAVRESEERFRSVAENKSEGLMIFDTDGNVVYQNPASLRIHGFASQKHDEATKGELIKATWKGWDERGRPLSPDEWPMARIFREGRFQNQILHAQHVETGREFDASYNGAPLFGAAGNIVGGFITIRDITQELRATRALQQSESQFRTLANAIPQLCWIANADGWIFWYNDRWYEYTGTTPQQMEGWGWQSVHDPDALPKVLERWQAAIATGEPWEDTFPLRRQDGSYGWFLSRALPILDGEGKVDRWFGTNTDITEQRRAEEKVRESEERLRIAVEAAELGTWDLDLINDIAVRSLRHDQIWGYTEAQPKWSPEIAMQHVVPEDRQSIREAYERGFKSGVLSHESRILWPDGSIHWISANGRFQYDDNGRPIRVVGVVADITERKAFQAELQRLVNERTAKLKELVGELEHFSYTITHDMRAPLRGMNGFAALMAEECQGCERRDATDFLRRIQASALRMDSLITDALNYSKVVRQELALAPVDVAALLRGMLDSYPEMQAEKAQIEITGELPLVMGNEAGLTQVLSNLLGNAIKFVKPGQKPEIRVWAEVRGEAANGKEEGERVRLWVEDNGIGIPDSMKPKLFELFSRGHRDYEGTGVGLALVRKVVERMGGKAGVESQEGRGSRFWVELKPGELRVRRT